MLPPRTLLAPRLHVLRVAASVVSLALLCTAAARSACAADPPPTTLRLPVTRDLWLSNVGDEANGNNGGAPRWKLKSNQEMTLFDVDPTPLRGRTLRSATLHVRSVGDPHLLRVTVSSVGAEWIEGTGRNYESQTGSSTFNRRRHPDLPWTIPGSDLCSVVLGQGGTLWRTADAFPPDAQGWQRIAVDPQVVAARLAGLSYGFLAFDDTGSEWTRDGERFQLRHFPNRFVHGRDSNAASAPYVTVELGPADSAAPAAPTELRVETADLPAGEALVSWVVPPDVGPAGTLGFLVHVAGREVPRYLVPLAGPAGSRVVLHVRDLALAPGARAPLAVRAIDAAGNASSPAELALVVSDRAPAPLPGRKPTFEIAPAALPQLADARVALLDELDKVDPVSGRLIPPQPEHYRSANHLWNAASRRVTLAAARNEFVACQVQFAGAVRDVRPELSFPTAPGVAASFGRYVHVPTPNGPLPDPVVPLRGGFSLPAPDESIAGQKYGSLHVELFVPRDAPAGDHDGRLVLRSGADSLEIAVRLRVWNFTLPDRLSFLPEMNCYGLPANERDYYRLAHRHRTVLNRVPYYQNGRIADGCAPAWNGREFDWEAWDRRFAPLLDGSAFADLPRRNVPVDSFYLPLHENWPAPIEPAYDGDYWADRAFTPAYRREFVQAARRFAEHLHERGWDQTLFQFFLNGKSDFKERGWSRASSPWLLDEPSNFQDYWALSWFGSAFHEGVRSTNGHAKLLFRADISRPQWQRETLDGLLDFNVVSGALRSYHRAVFDRKRVYGEVTLEYGGTNAITDANVQPLGWALDAWSLGCDGILPWQTVGTSASWTKADELALFYPPRLADGAAEPLPSVRLKAYRRGQQDVEYLVLLADQLRQPRWAIGHRVREALNLRGARQGTGFTAGEDAGRLHYANLLPQDAWALRTQVGEHLSQAAPPPRARLVEFRVPQRTPFALDERFVARGDQPRKPPRVDRPTDDAAQPLVRTLRGRDAVRDVLVDFERPDETLGAAPRDNAIRKAERSNAWLVRFDLTRLQAPADARVRRARLDFFVWDPSSRGDTKVEARALRTAWEEAAATWRRPAAGKSWRGGDEFSFEKDTLAPGSSIVVKPDADRDTADPPIEYSVDVTSIVQAWFAGKIPNEGLAVMPIADRSVDDGHHTRFQIYGSEFAKEAATPRLVVEFAAP